MRRASNNCSLCIVAGGSVTGGWLGWFVCVDDDGMYVLMMGCVCDMMGCVR